MPNTTEGLTVGGEEGLDPNDPAAFEQIMEGRGVAKIEGEGSHPETSIASGLTFAEPGLTPGRDADTGRFVSNQEVKTAAPVAPAAATETSGEENGLADDPEIEAFLAKYGGDVEKALKGAASAQSLIGRRDEEREKLATELAELRGTVQGLMAGAANAAPALTDDQVTEVATSRIESVGYPSAATEAANVAHTQNDERAYRTILEQWMIEDPASAMDFNTDFRLWQREQRTAAAAKPVEVPAWMNSVAEQAATDALTTTIEAVAKERGVANDSPIIAQMFPALEQMPKNVLEMVGSDDPEAQAAAIRLVMDRATVIAGSTAAAAAPVEGGIPPAVQRKLAGAAVASGALRPAEKLPNAPTSKEDAIKEFKRQIVEAPTTNIESGLTYGK